jgi:hypothetical protein
VSPVLSVTHRETLQNASPYFQRLLDEDNFSSACDEVKYHPHSPPSTSPPKTPPSLQDGRVFIDRDGDLFAVILSKMRSGATHVPTGMDVHRIAAEV